MRKYVGFILIAMLLADCGEKEAAERPTMPTSAPTTQPTLDINQIPVLGEENPPPPLPLRATDPRYPIQPGDEGKALYEEHCAACHGVTGEGQQPDPYAYGAAPPHDATGHTWHHPDQTNFLMVWGGVHRAGSMPAFFERLSADEIIQILAYLKTWWEPEQLAHQMELTQKLADQ